MKDPARWRQARPLLLSYRALGLGDLLTAVPALRALRRAFPHHHHVLATSGWLGPLVETIEAVDHHLPVDELAPIPGGILQRPDVAVNMHGTGPESHRVLLATRPHRLIAHAHREIPVANGPSWRAGDHEVQRWCRLLHGYGMIADPTELHLDPPQAPSHPVARGATVIHPGAKAASRRWPADRFATVAAAEARAGRPVVVTGTAKERRLAQTIVSAAELPASSMLAGRLDLGALAHVVGGAGRVVCGDTGVAHLATAYATPSVVLFGPVAPSAWGPPIDRAKLHRVIWAGRTGDPHADRADPGLLRIGVDEVLDELSQLDPTDRRRAHAAIAPDDRGPCS